MSEISDVLAAIESLSSKGEKMALATIVAVRGSTYRRPGARLLVPEDGAPVGNISGGCLEGDVTDMARVVMEEGTARLAGWDLTADDDAVWGLGLGCNGAIEVFIEPAEQAAEVAGALRMALEEERAICVVTVLESGVDAVAPGARIVVRPDGESEGGLGDPQRRHRRARGRGRATRPRALRGPRAARPGAGVRRGARSAAAPRDLRRGPRRHPDGARRGRPRLARDRRGRPAGVPHARALPRGLGLRPPGRARSRWRTPWRSTTTPTSS